MKLVPIDPKAFEIPAVFVNSFQLSVLSHGLVRLTFAERCRSDAKPEYRVAMILGIVDARQFCQEILTALAVPQGRS